ncbi:hypothetical protein [Mesorhizobium captivum]|uniref:hypothetical protein n=1 Tax=Mesorhizobium captivum TaxID=3072319 RepID=UPI002A240F47|nr:hypothetical protein [Mesorhizobium sp. VK22E]MDX8507276.1 hypothetical protein [Mesorhizobium sp. VK22E]
MSGTQKKTPDYTVVNLPVSQLRPSEEIDIGRALTLAKMIAKERCWTRPFFVERSHSVIMDGHHRRFCAIELGLSFAPCLLLSYDDPNLHVTSWYDQTPFAVDQIIQAGLSGKLMSFKTTRHKLEVMLPRCSVDLQDLK